MPFTVQDLHDLIRILEEHPEWRAEMRRVLLTEELLQLPELVRDLIEAQRRTEQQVAELVQVTRQHTHLLGEHSRAIAELTEAQRRTEQQVAELVEVTRQNSEQIAQNTQQLAQHSQMIAELVEVTRQNTQQLAQHSQMIAELREVTLQHTRAISELREAQQQTHQTVQRLEQTTMWLVDWQRGEAGRREGEQYERRVIRRAIHLFGGGTRKAPCGSAACPVAQAFLSERADPRYDR